MTVQQAVDARAAAKAANIQAQAESAGAFATVAGAQQNYKLIQARQQQELAAANQAIQEAVAAQQAAYAKSQATEAAYNQSVLDVNAAILADDQQGTAGQENPGNTGPIRTA